MATTFNRMLYLVGGCSAAFLTTPAIAQDNRLPALEEVIVTAARREQRLQDVPISVTAVTAETMEVQQIVDTMSLQKIAAGLQTKPTLSPLEMTLAIRGVTQLQAAVQVDPSIGVYVDGIYNVLNAGSNNGLIDMERAEVLRGPQGTLFGRNTIGGLISITTKKPTDEFEGYVQGDVGDYETYKGLAVVNLPIVAEKAAARLVYQHEQHDGYGDNFTTGHETGTVNSEYVRTSLRLNFSNDWELLMTGSYSEAEGIATPTNLTYFNSTNALIPAGTPPAVLPPGTPAFFIGLPMNALLPIINGNTTGDLMTNYIRGASHDTFNDLDAKYDFEQKTVAGTLTGQVTDNLVFKSITGYGKTDYRSSADMDGSPYVVLDLINYPLNGKQWSEEIQLLGNAAKLNWITGLYYFHNEGSSISNALVLPQLGVPNSINLNGVSDTDNDSYSAFVQLTYALTDSLQLTGGARYVRDKRSIEYRDHQATLDTRQFTSCNLAQASGLPIASEANCVYTEDADYNYVPWTAGLDYDLAQDLMVYAKVSKGFRAGAFPATGPGFVPPGAGVTPADSVVATQAEFNRFSPVDPEELLQYEIGLKGEFLDRRLRLNTALFHSKYTNIQIETNLPSACATCTPKAALRNSGEADLDGAELEGNLLIEQLSVGFGASYVDPEYTKGPLKGEPTVGVSKWNANLNLNMPVQLGAGVLMLNAGYSYRSEYTVYTLSPGLRNTPAARAGVTQDGVGTVDARVSFEFASLPLTLALWGRNLTDKEYFNSGSSFDAPLNYAWMIPAPPRTVGGSIRYSF